MEKLILGIALGQILIAALVVALQLLVAMACWCLGDAAWTGFVRGVENVASRVAYFFRPFIYGRW